MAFARVCITCGHPEPWHKSAGKPVNCFFPTEGRTYCGCDKPEYVAEPKKTP